MGGDAHFWVGWEERKGGREGKDVSILCRPLSPSLQCYPTNVGTTRSTPKATPLVIISDGGGDEIYCRLD